MLLRMYLIILFLFLRRLNLEGGSVDWTHNIKALGALELGSWEHKKI